MADVENQKPMQTDTIFAIASMTKPVTATAVMILQDEGKLSVDDPASKYVPALADVALPAGPPKRPITIRDLITHTSGIGGSQRNQGSLERTVELLAKEPLRFEPGAKWQYSPGLTVCGRIVEVASGQPFDRFLHERIFEPLRMVDTTFFPDAKQQKRVARLYKPSDDKESIVPTEHWLSELGPKRTPNPSGGLFSTATDMARFYQMILGGGQSTGADLLRHEFVVVDLAQPTCPGDVDGDSDVDQADLGILLGTYELATDDPDYDTRADLDCDGDVDQSDLGLLLAVYGTDC